MLELKGQNLALMSVEDLCPMTSALDVAPWTSFLGQQPFLLGKTWICRCPFNVRKSGGWILAMPSSQPSFWTASLLKHLSRPGFLKHRSNRSSVSVCRCLVCNNAHVSLFCLCTLSVSSSTALIPEARVHLFPLSLRAPCLFLFF